MKRGGGEGSMHNSNVDENFPLGDFREEGRLDNCRGGDWFSLAAGWLKSD